MVVSVKPNIRLIPSFLYSADSLIYYENMNEFNVGNDIYLTIELMHSVSINQNEE